MVVAGSGLPFHPAAGVAAAQLDIEGETIHDEGQRQLCVTSANHISFGTRMTIIIGIDCAVDPKNVGLARGRIDGMKVCIDGVAPYAVVGAGLKPAPTQSPGSQAKDGTADVVDIISGWMIGDTPILIALDAPLGWPIDLAEALAPHSAGKTIAAQPDNMFRRLTDHAIRDRLKKQSLDVGADHIGRTAHAALDLLQKLRMRTGQ